MKLINLTKNMFNKGVFMFDNGNYIFIEEIQYSSDGSYWEYTFNPNKHSDPRDLNNSLDGHKWRRVRHAGDDFFQEPEYIVAEDGDVPVFRVNVDSLEYKYSKEGDEDYRKLFDLDLIKGNDGEPGMNGEGWNIDLFSYWLERPDCPYTSTTVSSCNTCDGSSAVTTNTPALMLSLGDGLRVIETGDIGLFRSDDGINFIAIVATDVGNTTRYTATNASGLGIVDYHTVDSLSTRGKVYYCDEGSWKEFLNVAIPHFKVAPTEDYDTAFHNGLYMEQYVESPLTATPVKGTIAITDDYKLVVKLNSLEPVHFKDGSFGDGLDEGTVNAEGLKVSPIKVNASDFAGYGLLTYTRSDTFDDIEVDVRNLAGDGIFAASGGASVDGEDRNVYAVDVTALVEVDDGLETYNAADGYDNLRVKEGKGIEVDTAGVNVKVDDEAVAFNSADEVTVKDYVTSADGIQAKHLNPNTVNENKGLKVDNGTGIEITIASDGHEALAFDTDGIKVKNEGIQGYHLSSDVADEEKGLHFNTTSDKLEAKLKTHGGLAVDPDGLQIDTSDFTWLDGNIVKKIEVDGVDYSGDLVIVGDTASDDYMNIIVSATGQTITVKADTQLGKLQDLIDASIPSAPTTIAWSNVTGKPTNHVEENKEYGNNIQITSHGLFIKNTDGDWGKLVCMDSDFNLGVDETVSL